MLAEAVCLFAIIMMLALIEIEIEGKYGWSEKIPTWYRTTGFWGRIWAMATNGKPLTGYHLFLGGLILAMFHLKFYQGVKWSIAAEFVTIAKLYIVVTLWDFLWFCFNPHYTIKGFRKENIWWFSKSHWVLGLFPVDYAWGLGMSVILAAFGGLPRNILNNIWDQIRLIGILMTFSLIAIVLSPIYRRWYLVMRGKDDRNRAGIFHS